MIHSITANQPSFHTVTFEMGLNVILAERSDTSTERDTRNGVGKSTLIEIIDFCLGSRHTKGKGLYLEPLKSWAFTVEITLQGRRVKATRAVADANRIVIDGDTAGWPAQPKSEDDKGERVFNAEGWRDLLGQVMFNLSSGPFHLPYNPSYRSLISYFIRRGADAYTNPFRHFRVQTTWDTQLHVAYLLGLNWEYAARWQGLKDDEENATALEKGFTTWAVGRAIGTVGELETQRIQLEQEVAVAKEALDTFRVHPQYEKIQSEADRLSYEIRELVNKNVVERQRLRQYEESIQEEAPPATSSLEFLYERAGIVLSDGIRRTLQEAREFHHQIVANRRQFLEEEVSYIRKSIEERESEIEKKSALRADELRILQTHGALQEMTVLQEQYVTLQGTLERVQFHLEEMKSLIKSKREIKAAKADLVQTAERDHEERRNIWSEAVRLFNEHSQSLYKSPGRLIIDIDETGFRYSVDIERSGSEGIEKMKIFCFDLAAFELQKKLGREIDFLIHDTLMYDSVDARQRALALQLANEVTTRLGAQYICTINSDMVPSADFSEGFNFEQYVRLRLSDASPSDSLLGIRFERSG